MNPKYLFRLARTPHVFARLRIARDAVPWIRMQFLSTALEAGLLETLRTPRSRTELVELLAVKREDLLDVLLAVGVAVKELARSNGSYRIRGQRAKALLGKGGDPLGALVREIVSLHGPAYVGFTERLKGGELAQHTTGSGDLIARSSRIVEPFMQLFLEKVIDRSQPQRLLEVGCGSGIYLRHAASLNSAIQGVGLEMQAEVVQQAEANLNDWGLNGRFKIVQGDIRNPPSEVDGTFDLLTLYNNIYYFTLEERPALYSNLLSRLAPGGLFILVSMMQGNSCTASDLDLLLRSTIGWEPLPDVGELVEDLGRAGFMNIRKHQLISWEPFFGLVCNKEG